MAGPGVEVEELLVLEAEPGESVGFENFGCAQRMEADLEVGDFHCLRLYLARGRGLLLCLGLGQLVFLGFGFGGVYHLKNRGHQTNLV